MLQNLTAGLKTPPPRVTASVWLLVLPFVAFALIVGFATGLVQPEAPSWFELLVLPPLLIIYPSIIEESVFRGLLLPRALLSASRLRRFGAVSLSTGAFVLMHPINAWFVDLSDTSQFLEPAFIAIVTALGYTCAYLYLRSGSLWPAIALHWATVVVWNLFLGRQFSL